MGKVKGIFASNISGKVGNVVFRKNGKANVVSQRPANVKNPRTDLQQMQRAYVKSVASAYSVFKKICDHSFEGVSYGAQSMSYFNKVNYPVVSGAGKAVLKNSDSVVLPVDFIISKGSITWNSKLEADGVIADISNYLTKNNITNIADVTYAQLLQALGLKKGDQITVIATRNLDRKFKSPNGLLSQSANEMNFARYILGYVEDSKKAFLKITGSEQYTINKEILAEDSIMNQYALITVDAVGSIAVDTEDGNPFNAHAAIISRKDGDKWLRSNSVLFYEGMDYENSFDIAYVLSSYKPSNEPYLNGAEK